MRAVLLILILAVVGLIVAVQTGLVDVSQTRAAKPPTVVRTDSGLAAQPGQAPAFDVETGSVGIGRAEKSVPVPAVRVATEEKTVAVPRLEVRPPEKATDAPRSSQP